MECKKKVVEKEKDKRVVHKYGGAWRAYCHEHMKGRKFNKDLVNLLSESYGALSSEEKKQYMEDRFACDRVQEGWRGWLPFLQQAGRLCEIAPTYR